MWDESVQWLDAAVVALSGTGPRGLHFVMGFAMSHNQPSMGFSSQLGSMLRDAMQRSFGPCSPSEAWAPPVNVYQLPGRLEVCVDLSGVDREALDVRVEPGRLVLRGVRPAPEPADRHEQPMRIVCMEIDYGAFQREIMLPAEVALDRVESTYENGLLWITLPMG